MKVGILYCSVLAAAAWITSLQLPIPGSATLAILLGILFGNSFPKFTSYHQAGIQWCEKVLLPVSIVLMGFSLSISSIIEIGLQGAAGVLVSLISAFIVCFLVIKFSSAHKHMITLLAVGNGVCGTAAIAATSTALKSDKAHAAVSIAVVNLLGILGLALAPAICTLLSLDENVSGIFIGSSLQAVGQVSAAGFSLSDQTGETGTLIKMMRVLMLGPVLVAIVFAFSRNEKTETELGDTMPVFIRLFFFVIFINSIVVLPETLLSWFKTLERALLLIAMAAIGSKIQISKLVKQSKSALFIGALIWVCQLGLLSIILAL